MVLLCFAVFCLTIAVQGYPRDENLWYRLQEPEDESRDDEVGAGNEDYDEDDDDDDEDDDDYDYDDQNRGYRSGSSRQENEDVSKVGMAKSNRQKKVKNV